MLTEEQVKERLKWAKNQRAVLKGGCTWAFWEAMETAYKDVLSNPNEYEAALLNEPYFKYKDRCPTCGN